MYYLIVIQKDKMYLWRLSQMTTQSEFMTYKQAMDFLGLKTHNTLYRYIDAGLPIYVVGKSKRIKKSDIIEFMETHKQVSK